MTDDRDLPAGAAAALRSSGRRADAGVCFYDALAERLRERGLSIEDLPVATLDDYWADWTEDEEPDIEHYVELAVETLEDR